MGTTGPMRTSNGGGGGTTGATTSAGVVPPPPKKVIFISSDSGSTSLFREHEDGFAAYGASKAALNQMLRHMAAELKRRGGAFARVCVLAMHPGEVSTDMANIDVDWEVEGIISPAESVRGMLEVIAGKDDTDSGTFWCWDGRVSLVSFFHHFRDCCSREKASLTQTRNILGRCSTRTNEIETLLQLNIQGMASTIHSVSSTQPSPSKALLPCSHISLRWYPSQTTLPPFGAVGA